MQADDLLGHVLQDLEASCTEPVDEYRMIRASGLLRLLMADNPNLLDQVPWARRATFRVHSPPFDVGVTETGDIARGLNSGMFIGRWIAARDNHPSRDLSRTAFLRHVAASSSWTGELSVKTVIRVGATAFGGIHFDQPDDDQERKVEQVLRALDEGREPDTNTLCKLLREISATVVNSLHDQMPP
jgi:hypothetical protein